MKHKKVIVPLDEMVKTVVKAVVMDAGEVSSQPGTGEEVIRDIRQITKIQLQQQTLPIKKFVVMNGIDENTVLPINQIAYLKANGSYTEVYAGDGRSSSASRPTPFYAVTAAKRRMANSL